MPVLAWKRRTTYKKLLETTDCGLLFQIVFERDYSKEIFQLFYEFNFNSEDSWEVLHDN